MNHGKGMEIFITKFELDLIAYNFFFLKHRIRLKYLFEILQVSLRNLRAAVFHIDISY